MADKSKREIAEDVVAYVVGEFGLMDPSGPLTRADRPRPGDVGDVLNEGFNTALTLCGINAQHVGYYVEAAIKAAFDGEANGVSHRRIGEVIAEVDESIANHGYYGV